MTQRPFCLSQFQNFVAAGETRGFLAGCQKLSFLVLDTISFIFSGSTSAACHFVALRFIYSHKTKTVCLLIVVFDEYFAINLYVINVFVSLVFSHSFSILRNM